MPPKKKKEESGPSKPVDMDSAMFKAVRKRLGLTQAQFADRLGLSDGSVVWRKESGQAAITQRDKSMCEMFMREYHSGVTAKNESGQNED
jgi:DNA-binding transcriptional regulator YiaG